MGRLARAAFTLFGVSVITFLIFFATPGIDPAVRLAGRGASPATLAAVRRDYGLDRSLPVQYATLMRRLFWSRDLESFVNPGQRVVPEVMRAAPVTLALAGGAAVLWLGAGLAIGVVGAAWRGQAAGAAVTLAGLVGVSVPVFWLGEVVTMLSQSRLREPWFAWVPPLGFRPGSAAEWLAAMALPCGTLAVLYAGIYGRVLRAGLLEALRQDYVRTARAKGVGEARVLLVHALRNALGPLVALFGLDFGALVGGGTLLVEVVFGLRGVGRLTYQALRDLDLAMVMACVLYSGFFVVVVNAAADLLARLVDPRGR